MESRGAGLVGVLRVLVRGLAGMVVPVVGRGEREVGVGGDVVIRIRRLGPDGLVDRRLEAPEVDDDVGPGQPPTALGVSSRSWGSAPSH